MRKDIEEYIRDIHTKVYAKNYEVFEIFKDFFGEDKVDIQGIKSLENLAKLLNIDATFKIPKKDFIPARLFQTPIIIHFPRVIIRNEQNASAILRDIYVKVIVDSEGCLNGKFNIVRSTYTNEEFNSGYIHSHVPSLSHDNISSYKEPCLGSGPIRDTITILNNSYCRSSWELFCVELNNYLQVESLSGGPYRMISSIDNSSLHSTLYYDFNIYNTFLVSNKLIWNTFITYMIENNLLSYNFSYGVWNFDMSSIDFIIYVSNKFIEWWNKFYINLDPDIVTLVEGSLNKNCIKKGNAFHRSQTSVNLNTEQYRGQPILTFKNKTVTLKIVSSKKADVELAVYTLLPNDVISYIKYRILSILNYTYGNNKDTTTLSNETICFI